MRSRWVNDDEILTPFGRWLAARWPHVQSARDVWGVPGSRVWRLFGFRPYCRFCIVDYTWAGRIRREMRVFGLTVWRSHG